MKTKLAAIILAAGKGSRMKSNKVNKVAMHLANKPMILHTIELLNTLNIKRVVVVVGFAKKSVMELLDGEVLYAEQKKRLGTAHAVFVALKKLPKDIEDVLVLNGDDSAFYSEDVIKKLVEKHFSEESSFTFLTIEKENPFGLGRVLRDSLGKVKAIIEEKTATKSQKLIKEVNPACYIFKVEFLRKYLPKVKKNGISNEYYLTDLIAIGLTNNENVVDVRGGSMMWRGINTKEELEEAELYKNTKASK